MKNNFYKTINEFKKSLKINESIATKDWKRMTDLIQKDSEGEGVAATLKNKEKAINRFVAGLLLSGEKDITFGIKYNNDIIDKNNEYSNLPFKEFGNKALQLGATIEEIQNVYDNTEIPQQYKDLTDHSYLSKKELDSWVTGKVSKAILDAGYDINYLNEGGNAITPEGKDAMRRSGLKWTMGYRTEIIANGKTYKLDFDAITSEAVDDTRVLYVLAYSSDPIFTSTMALWKEYGIREFTKKIIDALNNINESYTYNINENIHIDMKHIDNAFNEFNKKFNTNLSLNDFEFYQDYPEYKSSYYHLKQEHNDIAKKIINDLNRSDFNNIELNITPRKIAFRTLKITPTGKNTQAFFIYDNVYNTVKESSAINEGQFSWFTQDTGTQIGSESENTISVYMYDNKGNKWHEPNYEGYGVFGGKDYYDLLAEMNGYTIDDVKNLGYNELRIIGIDLAYSKLKTKNSDGKLLFPALVENENYNINNHDFTVKTEDDPNQSWFVPDEDEYCPNCGSDDYDIDGICYDCDEDEDEEYYESKLYTTINEFKQYLNEKNENNNKETKDIEEVEKDIKKIIDNFSKKYFKYNQLRIDSYTNVIDIYYVTSDSNEKSFGSSNNKPVLQGNLILSKILYKYLKDFNKKYSIFDDYNKKYLDLEIKLEYRNSTKQDINTWYSIKNVEDIISSIEEYLKYKEIKNNRKTLNEFDKIFNKVFSETPDYDYEEIDSSKLSSRYNHKPIINFKTIATITSDIGEEEEEIIYFYMTIKTETEEDPDGAYTYITLYIHYELDFDDEKYFPFDDEKLKKLFYRFYKKNLYRDSDFHDDIDYIKNNNLINSEFMSLLSDNTKEKLYKHIENLIYQNKDDINDVYNDYY